MHDSPNSHHHEKTDGEHVHRNTDPYWKHAHHDWRFWVGMCLMVVAITVYFMSDDLSLVPTSRPQQSQSDAIKK
jgi:hypothetical protein